MPAHEGHRHIGHNDQSEWRDQLTESIQRWDERIEGDSAKVDKPDVAEAITEDQLRDAEARRDRAPDQGHHAEQPLALHNGPVVVPIAGYLATGSLRLKVHRESLLCVVRSGPRCETR